MGFLRRVTKRATHAFQRNKSEQPPAESPAICPDSRSKKKHSLTVFVTSTFRPVLSIFRETHGPVPCSEHSAEGAAAVAFEYPTTNGKLIPDHVIQPNDTESGQFHQSALTLSSSMNGALPSSTISSARLPLTDLPDETRLSSKKPKQTLATPESSNGTFTTNLPAIDIQVPKLQLIQPQFPGTKTPTTVESDNTIIEPLFIESPITQLRAIEHLPVINFLDETGLGYEVYSEALVELSLNADDCATKLSSEVQIIKPQIPHPLLPEKQLSELEAVEAQVATTVKPEDYDRSRVEVCKLSAIEPAAIAHGQEEDTAHDRKDSTKLSAKHSSTAKQPTEEPYLHPIWGNVARISDKDLEKLAMEHAPHGAQRALVIEEKAGMHNRVVIIEYQPNSINKKRCIRIPASGWEGRWSDLDKFQLVRSNHTMMYLKKHTSISHLIPEVFHWDDGLSNTICAPYTIMSFMEGCSPKSIWVGDIYGNPPALEDDHVNESEDDGEPGGDEIAPKSAACLNFYAGFQFKKVPPSLEMKRQNILKSLASSLAELRHLKFNELGSISFPQGVDGPPKIIPSVFLPFGAGRANRPDPAGFCRECTWDSTPWFLHHRLDQLQQDWSNSEESETPRGDLMFGMEDLYRLVVRSLPCPDSHPETFVLAPPDFGSQNILCDDEGNITALLDWDTVDTRSRLVGWCLAPDWLSSDWYGEDRYCWPNNCLSPREFETYRSDYARYLREACSGENADAGDWKHTTRSPMYERIFMAISNLDEQEMLKTMKALLATFLPRLDHEELMRQIGSQVGGGMGGEMQAYFTREFENLFGTEGSNTSSAADREAAESNEESEEESDDGGEECKEEHAAPPVGCASLEEDHH